ncbi:MAG: hexose kinase [Clostridiaceae bacterium]|nr:hexose kinase [Clostridiaceae bacterium]
MILTITLNPAVDISYSLERLAIDDVNRCSNVIKTAGGKGLNVTRVISLVGENVCATGLLGGANGQFIINRLSKDEITNDFVEIKGETRNCIAILHEEKQTEILEVGPTILAEEKESFFKKYEALLEHTKIVVASGSAPKDLGSEFYAKLIDITNQHNKKFLLDTSGEALVKALPAKPYLIKPNKDELSQLLKREIKDENTVIDALEEMVKYDIPYIIVSLGAEGAIALVDGSIYKVSIPKIEAVNPVGSGDATMAGFAIALKNKFETKELLKYGCVLGTLNALEEQTGYVNCKHVEEFMGKTTIELIKNL